MAALELALLHRGRFHPVPGAELAPAGLNAFRVTVPKSEAVRRLLRREVTAEAFDEAVWLVGETESVQSVGSADHPDHVEVTVLLP